MFKAHDIRVKADKLTAKEIESLCFAVVSYVKDSLKCKAVVLCRDTRLSSPKIAQDLSSALMKSGLDIFLNPLPISTCQFYYSCIKYPDCAGLMVTASHNPGSYVGIKIVGPKLNPIAFNVGPDGGIAKIKENYEKAVFPAQNGNGYCSIINHSDEYIDYCMKLAGVEEGSLSGMKILFEFLSGSVGTEIALAFQKAGAELTLRNIIPDGYFRQGDPNPIIESSISPARQAMKKGNFDLGFCFDGDGDRMDLMYSDGQQILPGLNMSVLVPSLMKMYKGTKTCLYTDAKANPVVISCIEKGGCKVKLIKNGHSAIKAKLKENPLFFGAVEESSHYYLSFPLNPDNLSEGFVQTESSLFFALLSAKCMKENPKKYEELRELQNSIYREREWAFHCEENTEILMEIYRKVTKRMQNLGAIVIDTMDDGTPLEASLMRFSSSEDLSDWSQVSQRISGSEDGVIRWEICSSNPQSCARLKKEILEITNLYK